MNREHWLSPLIDLGADRTRMRDQRDVVRQTRTAHEILERFYEEDLDRRFELQVLADEVGMGKTFVALAVAFSILEALRERRSNGLTPGGKYRRILVLVPSNQSLFDKWVREVGEFVKRCVPGDSQAEAGRRFRPEVAHRADELVARLRDKNAGQVLIAKTSALGGKIRDQDTKARLVLATLFRLWGTSFRLDARQRLLKGAKAWDWPRNPRELDSFTQAEIDRLPIEPEHVVQAIERAFADPTSEEEKRIDRLGQLCVAAAENYCRGREELVGKIRVQAIRLYKEAVFRLVKRRLPLVVVDEAHNWKNGPTSGSNNFNEFARWIGPRAERALLLTATPFQLRPDEMLEILKVTDHLALPQERVALLCEKRERHIRSVLEASRRASQRFARAWSALPQSTSQATLYDCWQDPTMREAVEALNQIADAPGALGDGEIDDAVDRGVRAVDPSYRILFREALRLHAYNRDLGQELGELVIRHRRHTEHRLVRVGCELDRPAEQVAARPDAHALHASAGIDVTGDAELPHYLLMRATSEIDGGKRRAALGSGLTGCYTTLFEGAEGRKLASAMKGTAARTYVDLLRELVGDQQADASHPKLRPVVDDVLARWERGEKSLIFTFRLNTAKRLAKILEEELRARLDMRKRECLGGENGLTNLRKRFTSREQDLIPLVLDRVLWSVMWGWQKADIEPFGPDELRPQLADYSEVARLALIFNVPLTEKLIDRVFLNRAVECAVAQRLVGQARPRTRFRGLLEVMAEQSWVARPYGGFESATQEEDADVLIDERGVHTVYEPVTDAPSGVEELAQQLLARDRKAMMAGRRGIVRTAFDGPSLWLGEDPTQTLLTRWHLPADVEKDLQDERLFHVHLSGLTWNADEPDWSTRAVAMQAVRRAALREATLVRLLPSGQQLEEGTWGPLIIERFTSPMVPGGESMLRKLGVFLEDIAGASGRAAHAGDARGALIDATRLRGSTGVQLVSGDTDGATRTRIFNGFNTPLLPEILVCTSVGQEGIDLHRQCRHVVHYDLAWNPATLEQRTGRVDRIGSAALRERSLRQRTNGEHGGFLEVAVPYLAGTYDERMFEELRLRAQTFEVLTGGDLAPDHVDGKSNGGDEEDEGSEKAFGLASLPREMIEELRVDLAVWREDGAIGPGGRRG